MLQHLGVGSKMASTQQEMLREVARREDIVHGMVDRRLMMYATMVLEGVAVADVVSLARAFSSAFAPDAPQELISSESLQQLIKDQSVPFHDMICHIRNGGKTGVDCEKEWQQFTADALSVLAELGSSFVQLVHPSWRRGSTIIMGAEGRTDPVLLDGMERHLNAALKILVKTGEDPASAVQLAQEAVGRLQALSDEQLLAYVDTSSATLSKKFLISVLRTACLPTTSSCSDTLAQIIWAVDNLPHGDGDVGSKAAAPYYLQSGAGVGSSLLQSGAGAVVQLVMKLFGLPEHPEETVAERAAAVEAYLKQQRALQSK